jgi:hypothetical protein
LMVKSGSYDTTSPRARIFGRDEHVKEVVVNWFQQRLRKFFSEGIHRLGIKWDSFCSSFFGRHLQRPLLHQEIDLNRFHLKCPVSLQTQLNKVPTEIKLNSVAVVRKRTIHTIS